MSITHSVNADYRINSNARHCCKTRSNRGVVQFWRGQPFPTVFFFTPNVLLTAFLMLIASDVSARTDPTVVCDHVAQVAAERVGVPVTVLQAITRTETGRNKNGAFGPWPWTVNMEGKGVWFETIEDARVYVFKNFKRGARSFDVGCFQINYKWHHKGFSSIDEMFDPTSNALYAARFLKQLYAEYGNWSDAAGAYHSRTPEHANRYKAVFEKHRSKAPGTRNHGMETSLPETRSQDRLNSYPLLQVGNGPAHFGSLVPIANRKQANNFIDFNRVAVE